MALPIYILFLAIISLKLCEINCENTCTTSRGLRGNCIVITECEDAIKLFRRLNSEKGSINKTSEFQIESQLRSEHCGFIDNTPKVCCEIKYKHHNLDLLPRDNCGLSVGSELTGGYLSLLEEFTWNVLLSYRAKNGTQFQCGGSLINEKYVLTAAECINEDLVGVRIGELKISSAVDCDGIMSKEYCSVPPQDIGITLAEKHEQYSETTRDNNIGLIRLNRSVDISSTISPVCLPLDLVLQNPEFEKPVLVVGWGATSEGVAEDSLLKIRLKVLTDAECNALHKGTLSDVLNGNKFCAGVVIRHICPGDTGGPLIYNHIHDRYVQLGIVNYKPEDCALGRPGVYTRITKAVLDWILDNMSA